MSIYINNNGTAERRDAGAGSLPTLSGLNDVLIDDSTLSDGDILVYDDEEEKWKNAEGSSKFMLPDGSNSADLVTLKNRLVVSTYSAGFYLIGSVSKNQGVGEYIIFTFDTSLNIENSERFKALINEIGSVRYRHNNVYKPITIITASPAVVTALFDEDIADAISIESGSQINFNFSAHARARALVSGSGSISYDSDSSAIGYLTVSKGPASHAEGSHTLAYASTSHAEGKQTVASGHSSHAEGYLTEVISGQGAHAEGYSSTVAGIGAHVEGRQNSALANYTHVEGYYNVSSVECQHVSGKYNNNKSDTLFEIGNGTNGGSGRSNAFEVTSDGYIRTKGRADKIAFGVDSNGNYGYIPAGQNDVTPFLNSNPNLLDNPWFTVNQRGQSSYTASGTVTYTIDRWYLNGDSELTINADKSITFTNNHASSRRALIQRFEKGWLVPNTTYTLSVKMSDNQIYSGTFTTPAVIPTTSTLVDVASFGTVGNNTLRIEYAATDMVQLLISAQSSQTIKAVKLELGSVSTLAMDTAPNYATELLKCQRYYNELVINTNYYNSIGFGIGISADIVDFFLDLPNTMRTNPTLTVENLSEIYLNDGTSNVFDLTSLTIIGTFKNPKSVKLRATKTGAFTSAKMYIISTKNTTSTNNIKLKFTADL